MSEPTPEAIEAAAATFPGYTPESEADDLEREINAACRAVAKRTLSAAAPYLVREAQAQALEAAAVMIDPDDSPLFLFGWKGRNLLRDRAAAIRDGDQ
jgi:hypothetical protein